MNIPMICIAVLGLLCFVLGLNVSIARTKAKRGSGCPTDPKDPLHKAIRAHANTVEYAPALMVLIYIASQAQMALWVMWTMVVVTACRILFVLGILTTRTMARPNPMRFIGALGTYAGGIALAVEVLFQALGWRVM
ncbi:MAPEG family protein [Spongiibacter marinus]|uniref:MAPEG family protein n=1 Tax=Spongiibacter marinus TaxID=354246 RepID=UPI00041E780C|nr:MAPEG family protein [Spongiibacter marinus]